MFVTYLEKYNQSNSDFPEHLNLYYLWCVSFLDVNLLYVVYLLNKVFKSEPHILIIVFYFNFQAARCCTPYITKYFSVPFHWITLMFNHGQLCLLFNFYIYTFVVTFDKVYSFPRRIWLRKGTELIIDIYISENALFMTNLSETFPKGFKLTYMCVPIWMHACIYTYITIYMCAYIPIHTYIYA